LSGIGVLRLETDPAGRSVTSVVVRRGGHDEVYEGDIVAVAAGVANSAAILLRSVSDRHPEGLATTSTSLAMAVNPALTAMANAIRVGEHLPGRMS
jgi:hypothetical protein